MAGGFLPAGPADPRSTKSTAPDTVRGTSEGHTHASTVAPRHAVLIFSGGLDSAVTAYKLRDEGVTVSLLSFNYGQRHVKELAHAANLADQLGVSHDIVDLTSLGRILGGSALTDPAIAVPHGHYRAETMRSTVVPNRNAIMLEIAAGAAVAAGADAVAFGAHSGTTRSTRTAGRSSSPSSKRP